MSLVRLVPRDLLAIPALKVLLELPELRVHKVHKGRLDHRVLLEIKEIQELLDRRDQQEQLVRKVQQDHKVLLEQLGLKDLLVLKDLKAIKVILAIPVQLAHKVQQDLKALLVPRELPVLLVLMDLMVLMVLRQLSLSEQLLLEQLVPAPRLLTAAPAQLPHSTSVFREGRQEPPARLGLLVRQVLMARTVVTEPPQQSQLEQSQLEQRVLTRLSPIAVAALQQPLISLFHKVLLVQLVQLVHKVFKALQVYLVPMEPQQLLL